MWKSHPKTDIAVINQQWLLQLEKFLDIVICPEKVSGGEEKNRKGRGKKNKKEQVQVFNQILVLGLVGWNILNNKPCTSRSFVLNLF